ncbi:MAG: hypothetical protein AAF850_04980 [Pseudomonadota bacterium]
MANENNENTLDAEQNRQTYDAVMRVAGSIGVPFSLALTMFFTNLVLANGIGLSIVAAVITYLAVFFIVKAFFSH